MEVIEQYHEFVDLPQNVLEVIEKVARTCYKSEDRISPGSAEKLIRKIIDLGHGAMIEFKDVVVKGYTNRGVSHELVRHRLASYAQESTRFVNYGGKDIQFIKPVWIEKDICGYYNEDDILIPEFDNNLNKKTISTNIWLKSCYNSSKDYNSLLSAGWKAQEARDVLNNAVKTEINMKANLREWRHVFIERCAKAAHPQMRALMFPVLEDFYKNIPVIFDDLYEHFIKNGEKNE
ncbi:MAG: FAD-dependent thymidylate synthase [Nanobdellota archaeon]